MTCFQRGSFVLTLWALSLVTLKHVKVRALALFQRDLFDGQRKGQHPKSKVWFEMFWMVGGSIFIRLACGSVVGHGLQHLRSRIDLGRARTLRK